MYCADKQAHNIFIAKGINVTLPSKPSRSYTYSIIYVKV